MNMDKTILAVPLYKSVYFDLKQKIKDNILKHEQKLPSEQYLCKEYAVSRITIRKALKLLNDENLIVTVQGKGSYVNAKKMSGKLNRIQGFSEFALTLDKKSSQTILKREILKKPEIAKLLLLSGDDDLIYIKRLFSVEKVPIAIDEAWFSAKRFPDLLTNVNSQTSLYEYLEEKYHESVTSSYREIGTILPDSKQNQILKLTEMVPLFEVKKTVYDQFGEPLEFSHYVVRGDKMVYTVDSQSGSRVYLSNKTKL